jgi:addiction module RelB/DinJ family antitoxin
MTYNINVMEQAVINFKIDKTIKKELYELCDELGLSVASVFNLVARKMISIQGIPFSVSTGELDSDSKKIDRKIRMFKSLDNFCGSLSDIAEKEYGIKNQDDVNKFMRDFYKEGNK